MNINISNSSDRPIYEQIASQIKEQIVTGALAPGEALPSMRLLARELRISLITTKRSYEELEREGFVETVPGKGSFVAPQNAELIREEQLRKVDDLLRQAAQAARGSGIALEELIEILKIYYTEE